VDTCSRDDNFVADTGLDGYKGYKWIRVDTTCVWATCIRCKRGIRAEQSWVFWYISAQIVDNGRSHLWRDVCS